MIDEDYVNANVCSLRAIELVPDNPEPYMNMNNILRELGKKEQAFDYVWLLLENEYKKQGVQTFTRPAHIDCSKEET